jgi:hypothetical protein
MGEREARKRYPRYVVEAALEYRYYDDIGCSSIHYFKNILFLLSSSILVRVFT